jgi:hypothetical protein
MSNARDLAKTKPLIAGIALATTSGTSIDITGIPSWAKRVTLMFSGVSTTGTSYCRIRLGTSGGIETSGYDAAGGYVAISSTASAAASTAGFDFYGDAAATGGRSGSVMLTNVSGNIWAAQGSICLVGNIFFVTGSKSLSGVLDRIRLTTVNGTDTFDAGSVNILYE